MPASHPRLAARRDTFWPLAPSSASLAGRPVVCIRFEREQRSLNCNCKCKLHGIAEASGAREAGASPPLVMASDLVARPLVLRWRRCDWPPHPFTRTHPSVLQDERAKSVGARLSRRSDGHANAAFAGRGAAEPIKWAEDPLRHDNRSEVSGECDVGWTLTRGHRPPRQLASRSRTGIHDDGPSS